MARIMVCDDDKQMSARLRAALEAIGHIATTCHHTMDVVRAASRDEFDLVAFGLEMSGFSSTHAALALNHLAPRLPLIAFHNNPAQLVGTPQHVAFHSILRRPVNEREFLIAVSRALACRLTGSAIAPRSAMPNSITQFSEAPQTSETLSVSEATHPATSAAR